MSVSNTPVRYRLIAQNCSQDSQGEITIQVIGQDYCLRKRAHEVLTDPELLHGFSHSDVVVISYIAYEARNQPVFSRTTSEDYCTN